MKAARAAEENARKYARLDTSRHGVVEASTPGHPKYAWLIHGSPENAAFIRKHGHGLPWRHKYKVLEVRPHAVRLEIPTDGSVPRVNEWQLRRRVAPAKPGEHTPGDDAPVITESGILVPMADPSYAAPITGRSLVVPTTSTTPGEDDFAGDEEAYEVDRVHHAERVGHYYKIYLLWKNGDITWRWYHDLRKETSNAELLAEMKAAVSNEMARHRVTRPAEMADAEVEDDASPTPVTEAEVEGAPSSEALGRGRRHRTAAVHHNVSAFFTDAINFISSLNFFR